MHRLFEELKSQHEQEKYRMTDEIAALRADNSELGSSNQKHIAEIVELKSILRLQKEWNELVIYDLIF